MSDPQPDAPADGRTARRDRNREAVLDAVLDLFADGAIAPAPAEVAARSGVSRRAGGAPPAGTSSSGPGA